MQSYLLERPVLLTFSWGVLLYFVLQGLGVWPPLAFVFATAGFVVTSFYLYAVINHVTRKMRR